MVYEVVLEDGSRAAWKVPDGCSVDAEWRALRLARERSVLLELTGVQGVVPLVGEQGVAGLLVRWATRGDLDSCRASGRCPTLVEVRSIGLEVGVALIAAHARGVVHRDVKPSNVLLHSHGAWLADWELAAFGSPPSAVPEGWVEESAGTEGFSPPELLHSPGEALDPSVDVFGYCALLRWMLGSCAVIAPRVAHLLRAGLSAERTRRPPLGEVVGALEDAGPESRTC